MRFSINYPDGMTAPKGLCIPSLEDVQAAVRLAEILTKYIDLDFEEGDEIPVSVNDEVCVLDGKLVDASLTEGITLHPSASRWTTELIFEMILPVLFGDKPTMAIPKVNLVEVEECLKLLINFVWGLQDKLPIVEDFCLENLYVVDTSISLAERIS